MKHILLIANIDGQSSQLIRYASKLCADLDLRLHILQIEPAKSPMLISSPHYMNKSGLLINSDIQNKKRALTDYLVENTKGLIDFSWVYSQLVEGNVQESLNAFINKERIDFVIASQSVFRNAKIGQNSVFTEVLLNIADIPTLVVPVDHSYVPFNLIGYLTTLKGNDYNNIEWVLTNFPTSKLSVLHFSAENISVQAEKKIKYLTSEFGENSFTYEKRATDIEGFIEAQIKTTDNEFDCLMVKTKKRNFWQRLIDPSTALNLILKIDMPTLVFKYKEEEFQSK